jgi:hypothetical protein
MAPIKFEDNIKDKLENRRLKPSLDAWDSLSKRLDNQDKKKSNRPFWWLGIAASVIGVLLVVSQFVNKDDKAEPIIVDVPVNKEEQQILEPTVSIKKELIQETIDGKTLDKSEYKKVLKDKTAIINNSNQNQSETLVVKNETKEEEKDIINNRSVEGIKEQLSFEEQQIQDVVAKVNALKEDNIAITDDDIDALLLEAQKEIRLNKIINKTTGLVDANALLQDVEAELDESFRSKVFEAIKSSYNSVKTAVAQRNN